METPVQERRKLITDDELRKIFHTLWTKAVGTPGYEKREWASLQHKLYQYRLSA